MARFPSKCAQFSAPQSSGNDIFLFFFLHFFSFSFSLERRGREREGALRKGEGERERSRERERGRQKGSERVHVERSTPKRAEHVHRRGHGH